MISHAQRQQPIVWFKQAHFLQTMFLSFAVIIVGMIPIRIVLADVAGTCTHPHPFPNLFPHPWHLYISAFSTTSSTVVDYGKKTSYF